MGGERGFEMQQQGVTVTVELSEGEALALAQLVKRMGFSDARQLAASDEEAYAMLDAIHRVQHGLAVAGFAPR